MPFPQFSKLAEIMFYVGAEIFREDSGSIQRDYALHALIHTKLLSKSRGWIHKCLQWSETLRHAIGKELPPAVLAALHWLIRNQKHFLEMVQKERITGILRLTRQASTYKLQSSLRNKCAILAINTHFFMHGDVSWQVVIRGQGPALGGWLLKSY